MKKPHRKIMIHAQLIGIGLILIFVCSTLDIPQANSTLWKGNDRSEGACNFSFEETTPPGSFYEYGEQIGLRYAVPYRILLTTILRMERTAYSDPHLQHHIEDLENNLEIVFPDFLEEMQGLAHAMNIPVERLLTTQVMLCNSLRGECTATLATGKATKNNETFLTFNIDASTNNASDFFFKVLLHRFFSLRCRMVRLNTLHYRYVYWGIPILYELPFLNEKGLGWGSPGTILTKENRTIDEGTGIATMLLEKLAMMICANVSQVASLYKNVERASQKGEGWFHVYDGSTSCFCDREGGILAIEQTHRYIITVFGNSTEVTGAPEGILWHANHHQWLDPNLTGSVFPDEDPSSASRADQARRLLEKNYGNITLEVCERITRDHSGGSDPTSRDSGDICRHPDQDSKKITAFSWIILPKDLTVYWTHGSPCRSVFWKHDFSKIFS